MVGTFMTVVHTPKLSDLVHWEEGRITIEWSKLKYVYIFYLLNIYMYIIYLLSKVLKYDYSVRQVRVHVCTLCQACTTEYGH